jgi:hypothetical protein
MRSWCRVGRLLLAAVLLWTGCGWGQGDLPPGWDAALQAAPRLADPGERVVQISARFLGIPYRANTLGGGPDTPEQLTTRLDAVDCFTLLDYVEALRRSATPAEFRTHLIEVRYRDGIIAWDHRRHFFTDWVAAPGGPVVNLTAKIGGKSTQQTLKQLNRRPDGTLYLPGVAVQERPVRFIPADALDDSVFNRLRPGDYLGIYAPEAGLDVSHVGIVVRTDDQLLLRHASSRRAAGRVIDSDLRSYLADKPGIIILRPVAP